MKHLHDKTPLATRPQSLANLVERKNATDEERVQSAEREKIEKERQAKAEEQRRTAARNRAQREKQEAAERRENARKRKVQKKVREQKIIDQDVTNGGRQVMRMSGKGMLVITPILVPLYRFLRDLIFPDYSKWGVIQYAGGFALGIAVTAFGLVFVLLWLAVAGFTPDVKLKKSWKESQQDRMLSRGGGAF
jgi:uncharacterized membrane protein YdbT with pleckstrin-like domain